VCADNAVLARRTAEKISLRLQRMIKEIIEIGADLIRVKDALGHGRFSKWLQGEFGWTDRTARNYLRAAEVFSAFPFYRLRRSICYRRGPPRKTSSAKSLAG
jgi:hypothetical protein